jgi:HAD superfamily hydrolase (TIGR01509 family)
MIKLKQNMTKAIIFDMDGVLILTEEMHFKLFRDSSAKFGIDLTKEDYVKFFAGRTSREGFEDFLKFKKEDVKLIDKIIPDFREVKKDILDNEMKEHIFLRRNTKNLLEKLKADGYKLGIGTSTIRKFTDITIKTLDIEKYFDVTVAGDEVEIGKPNPEIYLEVVKKLGVKSAECVVIEDVPLGVEAAKNAGMKCIAIRNEGFKLDLSQADEIVNSFEELEEKF